MPSVIIPVKTRSGKTTSVSIDEDIFKLLAADFSSTPDARAWVRGQASQLYDTSLTSLVRLACLYRIAKPSLVKRVTGEESQMDIEEV